jgi:hypothetical protein
VDFSGLNERSWQPQQAVEAERLRAAPRLVERRGRDLIVSGGITFEWLEGGRFLIQRSRNDHELFPDAICVIGVPEADDGLVMEYFDSRGVRRTYGVSLEDGVLRMWRHHPGFDQRFSAALGPDAFEGQWQLAETPGDWQDDLKVIYRRRE